MSPSAGDLVMLCDSIHYPAVFLESAERPDPSGTMSHGIPYLVVESLHHRGQLYVCVIDPLAARLAWTHVDFLEPV